MTRAGLLNTEPSAGVCGPRHSNPASLATRLDGPHSPFHEDIMGPLMRTNPLLGMWLGSAHAWIRTMHFWSGAWMFAPRREGPAREAE